MKWKVLLLILSCISLLASPILADITTTSCDLQIYRPTIQKIELSQDNGQTYTEIFSGNTLLDVTGVDPDNRVSVVCQNVSIPTGIYNYIRVTYSTNYIVQIEMVFSDPNPVTWYTHDGDVNTTPPAQLSTWTSSSGVGEGPLGPVEFTKDSSKIFYFVFYIEPTSVTATTNYTLFTLNVPADLFIEDQQTSGGPQTNSAFRFTLTATCRGGK